MDAGVSGLDGGVSGVEGGVVGVEGVDGELGAGSSLLLEELSSSLSEDSLDESSDFAGVGEGLGLGLGLGDGEGDGEGAGAGSFFFFWSSDATDFFGLRLKSCASSKESSPTSSWRLSTPEISGVAIEAGSNCFPLSQVLLTAFSSSSLSQDF